MGWKLPQLRPVLNEETSLFGTTPFSLPEARYFKYFIEKETLLVAVQVILPILNIIRRLMQ